MRSRWLMPMLAALGCAVIAACGGSGDRTPSLSGLPLAAGTRVTVDERTCDRGAGAYCSRQLVVVGSGYRSSLALLEAERALLRQRHWSHGDPPFGLEFADDSPGDRLRVTLATASGELEGVDLGWIYRSKPVRLALAESIFHRQSALSILLVLGTG